MIVPFAHVWTAVLSARRGTPTPTDHGRELKAVVTTIATDLAVYLYITHGWMRLLA